MRPDPAPPTTWVAGSGLTWEIRGKSKAEGTAGARLGNVDRIFGVKDRVRMSGSVMVGEERKLGCGTMASGEARWRASGAQWNARVWARRGSEARKCLRDACERKAEEAGRGWC